MTLRVLIYRATADLFSLTLTRADCRALLVRRGAGYVAFHSGLSLTALCDAVLQVAPHVAPSLTCGVMTEHGWRYH